jgi:hypothetical protein
MIVPVAAVVKSSGWGAKFFDAGGFSMLSHTIQGTSISIEVYHSLLVSYNIFREIVKFSVSLYNS